MQSGMNQWRAGCLLGGGRRIGYIYRDGVYRIPPRRLRFSSHHVPFIDHTKSLRKHGKSPTCQRKHPRKSTNPCRALLPSSSHPNDPSESATSRSSPSSYVPSPNRQHLALLSFPPPIFPHQTLTSIVCLAISSSLVTYYNDNGYPPRGAYKPRIRILLVASVWTTVFSRTSPPFIKE